MIETQSPLIPRWNTPPNYKEVLVWKVTENLRRVVLAQVLALLGFVLFGVLFTSLAISLGNLAISGSFGFGLNEMAVLLAGVVLTLVAHELTHGLAMRMFGAKPRYGMLWKGMMAYATSPGYAYQRNDYSVIALAPFVCISVLVVVGIWAASSTAWVSLLAICGVVNASGAIGDLWMTLIVLRYPPIAYIIDERDGIRVFLPKP